MFQFNTAWRIIITGFMFVVLLNLFIVIVIIMYVIVALIFKLNVQWTQYTKYKIKCFIETRLVRILTVLQSFNIFAKVLVRTLSLLSKLETCILFYFLLYVIVFVTLSADNM